MTGTSPPGPLRCGSTTCKVKAAATAASNALPPLSRIAMPTAVAIQWVEATTPKVPSISGRVVKGLGLTLLMRDPGLGRGQLITGPTPAASPDFSTLLNGVEVGDHLAHFLGGEAEVGHLRMARCQRPLGESLLQRLDAVALPEGTERRSLGLGACPGATDRVATLAEPHEQRFAAPFLRSRFGPGLADCAAGRRGDGSGVNTEPHGALPSGWISRRYR